MKLAAIYNVWDGVELLRGSMSCMKGHVDLFVIVYQDISNFGERYDPLPEMDLKGFPVVLAKYTPAIREGVANETTKRNIGLDIARNHGCTHFLHIDCDEYYEDFGKAKQEYLESGHVGSVCPIYTYFKKSIWRLENLDEYFVPFIHELFPDTKAGGSPYQFFCDPTRVINQDDVTKLNSVMHHFSWVRKDIGRKVRNSSARQYGINLKGLLADYHSPELEAHPEGYIIRDMGGRKITIVPSLFGLSE